jgi:outer membrane protein assembly factor BamD (BamD/ComL family)
MKKQLILGFITIFSSAIIFSCTSQRDREAKGISKLEEELTAQAARPEPEKLNELMDLYLNFIENHPTDSTSPQYLYKAVNLAMGMNNGPKAMELVDRTLNEYPNSSKQAETIFLKAYIYENLLSNLGLAQKTYRDFLSRYPDHELSDDAEAALMNLGKSPEELVREFEARAAEQAASSTN